MYHLLLFYHHLTAWLFSGPITPTIPPFCNHVIQAITKKDLHTLQSMVRKPLLHGPNLFDPSNVSFDAIFSSQWRQNVIHAKPPCERVGTHGWMIANGLVWIDQSQSGDWQIITLNTDKKP